jgi:hypothetical protein
MGQAPGDDVKRAAAVEREVDELRERTQALLEELERRVREGVDRAKGTAARVKRAVDVRAQLRRLPGAIERHPLVAGGVGLGGAVAIGLGVWLAVERRREARRPMTRLRRRAATWRALVADPRRALSTEPRIWRRVLTAVLVTAATALARNLIAGAFTRAAPRELPEPLGV